MLCTLQLAHFSCSPSARCQITPLLSSDPGYNSACGSVSPACSVDSGYLSPPPLQWGAADRSPLPGPVPMATVPAAAHPSPARPGRRSRSKHPGRKRQSASEREKLRMRDLAKALHHLRTFLPPSVAPAGQTLTKIDTLRLASRYIAHLSAQLEEDRVQGGPADSSPPLPGAQDHLQTSFQPSVLSESLPSVPLGFPHASDHLSPLPSYQNPLGDFCFTDVSSECFWIPEISHTLYGK
ncbi:mesoderm posterior protein 1-like [Anguilla anguilla]|uniref:mesoderm posterior protein 1-like n=1 Tax=Anguilla anguilla TaxID=7936 RepID=UPI0015AF1737|nr:mesoderm posterior protein 1-like [Anguilla anguilla]